MVTATAPYSAPPFGILMGDHLGGIGGDRLDVPPRPIDLWIAALARGDDAEVDRLVRQSRVDRLWAAAYGQLGVTVG